MLTKAAIYRGDKTFSVDEKEVPRPATGEVQVDVAYCGICGTDLHIYLGHMDQRVGFERTDWTRNVRGHIGSGRRGDRS